MQNEDFIAEWHGKIIADLSPVYALRETQATAASVSWRPCQPCAKIKAYRRRVLSTITCLLKKGAGSPLYVLCLKGPLSLSDSIPPTLLPVASLRTALLGDIIIEVTLCMLYPTVIDPWNPLSYALHTLPPFLDASAIEAFHSLRLTDL